MNVVDIRNAFVRHKVTLIEVEERFIYYSEEKTIDGEKCFFLLQYEIATNLERILFVESLGKEGSFVHSDASPSYIQVYTWTSQRGIKVIRIAKEDGAVLLAHTFLCVGNLVDIFSLNQDRFLGFFEKNLQEEALFDEYKEYTGGRRVAFLYDLTQNLRYLVRDQRICQTPSENMRVFTSGDKETLLLSEANVAEDVKWYLYNEKRSVWLGREEVRDCLWKIPTERLVEEITEKKDSISLEEIAGMSVDGYIRYVGMDSAFIYYRSNFFPANVEKLCSYDKETGEISVILECDRMHQPGNVTCRFSKNQEGYRITEEKDTFIVEGIWNQQRRAVYPKKLGEFSAFVGEKYLITAFDRTGEFPSWFLYDVESGREQSFQGYFSIYGETLVLYC